MFPMPMPLFRWLASIGCPPGPNPMPIPPSPSERKRESQKCRFHLLKINPAPHRQSLCAYHVIAVSLISTYPPSGSIHNSTLAHLEALPFNPFPTCPENTLQQCLQLQCYSKITCGLVLTLSSSSMLWNLPHGKISLNTAHHIHLLH